MDEELEEAAEMEITSGVTIVTELAATDGEMIHHPMSEGDVEITHTVKALTDK